MRLIDADALIDELGTSDEDIIFEGILEDAPTIDAVPVRHAEWMPLTDCLNEGIYCSACHKKVYRSEYSNTMKMHSPYCPNCGAKMDGDNNAFI